MTSACPFVAFILQFPAAGTTIVLTANERSGMSPVLVVEDNEEVREVLAEILRAEGAEVACAADGAEGWALAAASPRPCLILLDLKMPVMDGLEFLRRRNADPELAKIPVIMLTGTEELAGRETELNFQGFVRKPFDPDRLMELVRQHCD
jgi:CheY-like chemotaxis protein